MAAPLPRSSTIASASFSASPGLVLLTDQDAHHRPPQPEALRVDLAEPGLSFALLRRSIFTHSPGIGGSGPDYNVILTSSGFDTTFSLSAG
jgi:hypothetical protein